MEDVLLTALTAERVLLRKEIRHCQSQQKALTTRAENLETEVLTLEEAIDDRRTAKYDVQAASAANLEAQLNAQKQWNDKAEAKIAKLSTALRRKRESCAWMAESKDYLGNELLGLLTSLQHFTAMQRSEQLSDVQYLTEQVKVKLLHSQFAAHAEAAIRRRHASTLSVLLGDTDDKKQYLHESSEKKLNALLWEREKFTKQFHLAKQLSHSKRTPTVDAVTGDIKDAHLAQCMYLPRAAASRSTSVAGADSGGNAGERGIVAAASVTRNPDPAVVPSSPASPPARAKESSVETVVPVGLYFPDDDGLTNLLSLSTREPSITKQQGMAMSVAVKEDPAIPSGVSTPRFSRGPTPRFGTPKLTPHLGSIDEVPIISSNAGGALQATSAPKRAPGKISQVKILKKPRPQKLLTPAVAIRPSGRATPPSSVVPAKQRPPVPIIPITQPVPGPAPAAVAHYVTTVVSTTTTVMERPADATPAEKSAVSLNKALQTAPPMLSRFAYSRTGASKIAFGQNT